MSAWGWREVGCQRGPFGIIRHLGSAWLYWAVSASCPDGLGSLLLGPGFPSPPFTCFTPNTCSLFRRQPLTPLQRCQECLGVSSWGRCWPAVDWSMKMNVQLPCLKARNTDIIYTLELPIGSGRGKLNLASISCISPPPLSVSPLSQQITYPSTFPSRISF